MPELCQNSVEKILKSIWSVKSKLAYNLISVSSNVNSLYLRVSVPVGSEGFIADILVFAEKVSFKNCVSALVKKLQFPTHSGTRDPNPKETWERPYRHIGFFHMTRKNQQKIYPYISGINVIFYKMMWTTYHIISTVDKVVLSKIEF